jgi:transposase
MRKLPKLMLWDSALQVTSMIRQRQSEALESWLGDVLESDIEALGQFARGIKQDLDAVTNALSLHGVMVKPKDR